MSFSTLDLRRRIEMARALGGAAAVGYQYRAPWTAGDQDFDDAQVLNTTAEGVTDGTFTVVEFDGDYSVAIASNQLTLTKDPASGGSYNKMGILGNEAIARTLGTFLIFTITGVTGLPIILFGWTTAANLPSSPTSQVNSGARVRFATGEIIPLLQSTNLFNVVVSATNVEIEYFVILGGFNSAGEAYRPGQIKADFTYGHTFGVRGSAYTTATIGYITTVSNSTPLYPFFEGYNDSIELNDIRVPVVSGAGDFSDLLIPAAMSTFSDSDDTGLDAISPEIGANWVEQLGAWDIQSNSAELLTPDTAVGFQGQATVETSETDGFITCNIVIGSGGSAKDGVLLRFVDNDNWWGIRLDEDANEMQIIENSAGTKTDRASVSFTITEGSSHNIQVRVLGDKISAYRIGSRARYTSALHNTATKHGLYSDSTTDPTTNTAWANWHFFTITGAEIDAAIDAVL